MSTAAEVRHVGADSESHCAPPPSSRPLGVVALICAALTTVSGALILSRPVDDVSGPGSTVLTLLAVVGTLLCASTLWPAVKAMRSSGRSVRMAAYGAVVASREPAANARRYALGALGGAAAVWIALAIYAFCTTNDFAVQRTFLDWDLLVDSAPEVIRAAKLNLLIAVVAEALILVWALLLAVLRSLPGPAARPLRILTIAYVDLFRAVPTIVIIYLVAFGLPLTGAPLISELDGTSYVILALTLTYGAYVAELYRSGIDSIHPSQAAAARSLGLTAAQTLRSVVIPQAVRRLIPPLLGFFISLQKDTALVLVVGLVDTFAAARIFSASVFNLSPVTLVGIMFFVITIPQTRLVDHLIRRQARREGRTA